MTQTISNDELELLRHVPLHRIVGNSMVNRKVKIKCPFHQERTASLVLFPAGGFKCFGCGKGSGSSIDFLMELGATFPEAIEELRKYI
jgi:DNA primase